MLALTAESPDFSFANGTTPSEAVAWLVSRADAVGDRISSIDISDDGVVDWGSVTPWLLEYEPGYVIIRHRYLDKEAPELFYQST